MNLNESINSRASVKCASCGIFAFDSEVVCPQCNYPLKGTEKDQKDFLFNQEMRSIDLHSSNKQLKKAGNMLYYIAAIFVISSLIIYAINPDSPGGVSALVINLVLAMIFVVLAGYSQKRPMLCIITGLVLFSVIMIGNAIVEPVSLVKGAIFKVFAFVLLINGLKSAREVERIREQYPSL